jgi:acyl-CoA synthetase (NDP forming)
MPTEFKTIDRIFAKAENDGRLFLFEHEVYAMLAAAGLATPKFRFIPKGRRVTKTDLAGLATAELVIKITAPLIQHKTDVGGVAFVRNSPAAVNAGIKAMMASVPERYRTWLKKIDKTGTGADVSAEAVRDDIRGVLVCEKVDYEKFGFGTELLIGVRNSREFGPVISLGPGGVEVEYLTERIKDGQAASISSADLLQARDVPAHLRPLAVHDKLVKPFRGQPPVLSARELYQTYLRLAQLAAHYSPFGRSRYVWEEMEVNPFVVRRGRLIPLDGLCRFSRNHVKVADRPVPGIGPLLHPKSVAVIGVSEKMNLGHIILNNVLKLGFSRDKVYVVKPGLREIEGCACVPDVASLPEAVDLFVLTLGADLVFDIMSQLITHEKARSVIIIAGGMGEKQGTQSLEEKIISLLAEGRAQGKLTPVVNGGNCLGIFSKPGHYDTTFIPEHKLRFPKTEGSSLAHISQSGAFMICRVSKLQRLGPLYGISLGNQLDLRISDYVNYLKDEPEVKIFAVYAEGFKPGDGYLLARAARDVLKSPDRHILVYKSGRSPEGRIATAGHTASVAGDYHICRAILEDAGCIVVETIFEFENFLKGLTLLSDKKVRGRRVGLMSNAGFESVIMADGLSNGDKLTLAAFGEETRRRLAAALAPLGIDKLQDIKNPLDVTPQADDAAFCACAEALLADPGVDCAVISPVPMTPAMQTLAPGPGYTESIYDPKSTSLRLAELFRATDKPFVVNIDAGSPYDAMAEQLEDAGVPVFRRADDAMAFLRRYVAASLKRIS